MTRGDVVGRSVETSTKCLECRHIMAGADKNKRCRRNGLEANQANADDCREFDPNKSDWLTIPLCGGCNGN